MTITQQKLALEICLTGLTSLVWLLYPWPCVAPISLALTSLVWLSIPGLVLLLSHCL